MIAWPYSDVDSMCSMSLTEDEYNRSLGRTIRRSMSSGERPAYCQKRVTTGMLIAGKMSTAILTIANTPKMTISSDTHTKVHGRHSARRTSHIILAWCSSPYVLYLSDVGRAGETGVQETGVQEAGDQ